MEEINIKDFFKFLLENIAAILIVSFAFLMISFIYSKYIKEPLYEANTTLLLTKVTTDETSINSNDINLNKSLVSTYSELIKSRRVLNDVIESLDINYSVSDLAKNINIQLVSNTEMLKISVRNPDAELSKSIANKTAESFSVAVSEIYGINNIKIVDEAITPKAIANNTTQKDAMISFMLGLIVIISILFIIYYFDDTIKYTDNLEEELKIPIVGKIGLNDIKRRDNIAHTELIVSKYPKSLISEGIKTLRTNLQFSSVDKKLDTLLITSSIPGEGKSFISANLAIAFAQTGIKVLIVDCDMRKGRQHKIFNVSNKEGLSNLLIDDLNNLNSGYIKKTSIKNLYLLTCGTIPPNPSELLNSEKNKELITKLKVKYDLVIFDGVPCNGLSDSIIMSRLVDKTLIVSAEGKTTKALLDGTKKALEGVNANIAGDVLNKIDMNAGRVYGKYYSYYGDKKNG